MSRVRVCMGIDQDQAQCVNRVRPKGVSRVRAW